MKKIWIITLIGGTIALSTGIGIKTLFIRANFEFEEAFPEHYSQQQHLKKAKTKIPSRDTETDESFQKFLDDKHPFSILNYIPKNLLPIPSDFTANNAKQFLLREEAGIAFADMARSFQNHFQSRKKLSITSAYRSYEHQKQLQKQYCRKNLCAEPGSSEHQAGLAIDLGVNKGRLDPTSLNWLKENAHLWGFHNTYQKGVDTDGKMPEPWHWRYLGTGLATLLYEQKLSFGEWFYQRSQSGTLEKEEPTAMLYLKM